MCYRHSLHNLHSPRGCLAQSGSALMSRSIPGIAVSDGYKGVVVIFYNLMHATISQLFVSFEGMHLRCTIRHISHRKNSSGTTVAVVVELRAVEIPDMSVV